MTAVAAAPNNPRPISERRVTLRCELISASVRVYSFFGKLFAIAILSTVPPPDGAGLS
jgi:hypothetical protein